MPSTGGGGSAAAGRAVVHRPRPLIGADGYFAMGNQVDTLADEYGLHPYRVRHVLDRYGSMIRDVLEPGLAEPALLERCLARRTTSWPRSGMR